RARAQLRRRRLPHAAVRPDARGADGGGARADAGERSRVSTGAGAGPAAEPRRRKVSAIIACYKDAQAIPIMAERLKAVFAKAGVDGEIIFVNDGSPDDTQDVLERLTAADPT